LGRIKDSAECSLGDIIYYNQFSITRRLDHLKEFFDRFVKESPNISLIKVPHFTFHVDVYNPLSEEDSQKASIDLQKFALSNDDDPFSIFVKKKGWPFGDPIIESFRDWSRTFYSESV